MVQAGTASLLSQVQGQGQLVKSAFCKRRHISLADLGGLMDVFSELTRYLVGVYPQTDVVADHSTETCVSLCVW